MRDMRGVKSLFVSFTPLFARYYIIGWLVNEKAGTNTRCGNESQKRVNVSKNVSANAVQLYIYRIIATRSGQSDFNATFYFYFITILYYRYLRIRKYGIPKFREF